MEKTPPFDLSPCTVTITKVTAPPRKLSASWTLQHTDYSEIYKPYELTEEEKASLSPDEQETWKVLKTTEKVDIESEIMSIMSEEISKEIDAEILKEMTYASGTSAK